MSEYKKLLTDDERVLKHSGDDNWKETAEQKFEERLSNLREGLTNFKVSENENSVEPSASNIDDIFLFLSNDQKAAIVKDLPADMYAVSSFKN